MAKKIIGHKWEMNYRGYDVYYCARLNRTIAINSNFDHKVQVIGTDGKIFSAIDTAIAVFYDMTEDAYCDHLN